MIENEHFQSATIFGVAKVLGQIWKTKGGLHLLQWCKTSRFIVAVLGSSTGFTLVSNFDKIQRAGCEHAVIVKTVLLCLKTLNLNFTSFCSVVCVFLSNSLDLARSQV